MNETEHRQRERFLFAVLLLFGIGILLYVGKIAIGIAPNWEVAANMRSNLDPNSDFLTRKNSGLIEPLNPDILTLPAWLDIFFTPNATLPINPVITPPATRGPTRAPTQPATLQPTFVNTLPATAFTVRPPTQPGNKTPTTTTHSANLAITKTDGSTTYIPGSGISYQIVVTNGGPNNASGFRVTDTVPAVISITSVNCAPSGTASCGTNGSSGNNVSFTGISVNAGAGNRITITINGTVNAGATGNLVNTARIVIPGGAGFSDPNTSNNTATDTDTPVLVDLSITKTDGSATYIPGGGISYQIVVTNSGPNNASGFSVTDTVPAVINGLSVSCATSGTANCGTNGTIGNVISFTGISVDAGAGNQITITVNGIVDAGATGNLVNTADIVIPGGASFGDPNTGNNTYTDTDPPPLSVDLSISKDDGINCLPAGGTTNYTVIVANNSATVDVTGATVSDFIPTQIASWTWSCTNQLNGANGCDPAGASNANFSDTVNLPAGSSIIYTVSATASATPSGDLTNTATVSVPTGYIDPNGLNDSMSDTDTISVSFPSGSTGSIGTTPDTVTDKLWSGGSITLTFGTPITVTSPDTDGYDLVYYEFQNGVGILLDNVVLQLGDGTNWYTIFDWGSDPLNISPDLNTNLAIPLPVPPNPTDCSGEPDECPIDSSLLIDPTGTLLTPTGIGINLDGVIPNRAYYYIRILSPSGDAVGDGLEVDGIYVIP
jgi:fimbrial isopeptide formation D2 family protein/uncharacterized repeat protein (TIGR01451 family)